MIDLIIGWGLRILAVVFLFEWMRRVRDKRVRIFPKSKHWIVVFLLTAIPVVSFYLFADPYDDSPDSNWLLEILTALFFSGSISGIWAMFIRKLDIYETESWWSIIATIGLGAICTFGVFPLNHLLVGEWTMNGTFFNDMLYCILAIGGIEEFVKLVPLLIVLRFTKWANEPLDLLLYASFSALGFAFVENTMYIMSSEFVAIPARAFLASVAHMTFGSLIAYALMAAEHERTSPTKALVKGYLLAIIAHGLYDFWLMYGGLGNLSSLTFLLFLGLVHAWFQMLNNGINLSPFYSDKIVLRNHELLGYLTLSVLSVMSMSITGMALKHGLSQALKSSLGIVYSYGYLAVYLVLLLSRSRVIDRLFKPIDWSLSFLFPTENKTTSSD